MEEWLGWPSEEFILSETDSDLGSKLLAEDKDDRSSNRSSSIATAPTFSHSCFHLTANFQPVTGSHILLQGNDDQSNQRAAMVAPIVTLHKMEPHLTTDVPLPHRSLIPEGPRRRSRRSHNTPPPEPEADNPQQAGAKLEARAAPKTASGWSVPALRTPLVPSPKLGQVDKNEASPARAVNSEHEAASERAGIPVFGKGRPAPAPGALPPSATVNSSGHPELPLGKRDSEMSSDLGMQDKANDVGDERGAIRVSYTNQPRGSPSTNNDVSAVHRAPYIYRPEESSRNSLSDVPGRGRERKRSADIATLMSSSPSEGMGGSTPIDRRQTNQVLVQAALMDHSWPIRFARGKTNIVFPFQCRPTAANTAKAWIEHVIREPINWWPLSPRRHPKPQDSVWVEWQWVSRQPPPPERRLLTRSL